MEIMTGRPDACLPSVRAHILTMPGGLQPPSAWLEKTSISLLTARNSLIATIAQAAVLLNDEAVELIDGRVASFLDRSINGRCRRTSLLELIRNSYHFNRTKVYCGGLAGGFKTM